MIDSDAIAYRFWNLPQKCLEEARRESLFIDDIIQKAHIQRELDSCLANVETAFDGGGGTGRFSVYLAGKGIKVTHFDISESMLIKAHEYAEQQGVSKRMVFVQGTLTDLSMFADRSFDLVMSFDAPISYTYPHHESVIRNLARMSNDKLMVSVSSRLGSIPYLLSPAKTQYLLDTDADDPLVRWYKDQGQDALSSVSFDMRMASEALQSGLLGDPEETKRAYQNGEASWPTTYLFLPDELLRILDDSGVRNVKLAGPGAFSRSIPNTILVRIMKDPVSREAFLSFCYQYDSIPWVAGLGKDNLLASGSKQMANEV